MKCKGIHVIIMCKAPVAGRVKTRLMSRYSADEAAALHTAMATTVINRAIRLFEHVVIAADDPGHPFFSTFGLPVKPQGDGNLGDRMNRQVEAAFADAAQAVMLLGTDSPHMTEARLLRAVDVLQRADVVLGPVEDGGYDLVGMRAAYHLFDGVVWSSGKVLAQTVANADVSGLNTGQLEESFDVDFPDDIERAVQAGWEMG